MNQAHPYWSAVDNAESHRKAKYEHQHPEFGMKGIDRRIRKLELKLKESFPEEDEFTGLALKLGISLTKVDRLREAITELPSLELLKLAELPLNAALLLDLS